MSDDDAYEKLRFITARQDEAYRRAPTGTWAQRWLPWVCGHERVRCTHGDEIIGRRWRRRVCQDECTFVHYADIFGAAEEWLAGRHTFEPVEIVSQGSGEDWRARFRRHGEVNYDGPDPSVKCAYGPCTNRLRRGEVDEPQWCSTEHRELGDG